MGSRMETFWYRLTQVHWKNGRYNGERERARERERERQRQRQRDRLIDRQTDREILDLTITNVMSNLRVDGNKLFKGGRLPFVRQLGHEDVGVILRPRVDFWMSRLTGSCCVRDAGSYNAGQREPAILRLQRTQLCFWPPK